MRNTNDVPTKRRVAGRKVKSFARLASNCFGIKGMCRAVKFNSAETMKTLLIFCLSFIALSALAQTPQQRPAQPPPPPPNGPPAAGAPAQPGAPAQQQPGAPAQPGAPVQQPPAGMPAGAPGMSPAGGPPTGAPPAATITATLAPSPVAAPTPEVSGWSSNFIIDNFRKGGPIMWPILLVSIVALTVVIERIFWWGGRWFRRDPKRIEKVFTAVEVGDVSEASRLSRDSRDPVLRMMWNGLNHQHASLQGALQVAAGIEIKRAGRFLVVMDTL